MRDLSYNFFVQVKMKIFVLSLVGFVFLLSFPAIGASGQYLVATKAARNNDFDLASKNYLSLIKTGISETLIVQEALLFSVLANDLESALKLSTIIEQQSVRFPTAGLISLVRLFNEKEVDQVQNLLSRYEEILPRYLITLAQGWTEIANGSLKKGIERFSSLDGTNRHLGSYNCAVAFAIAGDFQNALLYLEELEDQNLKFDELQLQALVQIYSNNNLNNKAVTLLEGRNKDQNSGIFNKVVLDLKNGNRLKFNAFRTPADALANVFYLMGSTSANAKKNPRSSGFYIQLAELLSGDKDYYNMRLGEIFRDMRTFNYSIKKFNKVRDESIFYSRAQLGVADTLVRSGRSNLAQEILEQLIEDGFNEFVIFDALADIFRVKEDYERAIYYYDMALKNITEDAKRTKWSTFFVRGISYDQFGNWERAKVDLRNALELSSNHPEVLNYFGYSLIERNESLEKALKMIENAVSQRPESGYIIDSLAWGLFRLGHYKEAILPMERAVQLEPHDPIVNDHLGDILWMIGRKREATFQWKRALFFGPTAENEKEIKKKLKFGITDSYNSD